MHSCVWSSFRDRLARIGIQQEARSAFFGEQSLAIASLCDREMNKKRAKVWIFGAGSGNRTRIFSLEGYCSTIELYPLFQPIQSNNRFRRWWRRLDSNQRTLSERIYSPSPLTTRTLLHLGGAGLLPERPRPKTKGFEPDARYAAKALSCQPVRGLTAPLKSILFSLKAPLIDQYTQSGIGG